MASGQIVVQVLEIVPPQTNYATPDTVSGGSTPAEYFPVWDFDADSAEHLDFLCYLNPDYAGGGLTFVLCWSATSATTGNCMWDVGIRRLDAAEDASASHTYDYNNITVAAPATLHVVKYTTRTFTDGADMDSWAAGELALVRVRRRADNAGDTMAGDAELWGLVGKET